MAGKKFIIWDPKDGTPRLSDTGVLGSLTEDNVYLTAYAGYPDARTHRSLEVGEHIAGVTYRLGGERGIYNVYRVE